MPVHEGRADLSVGLVPAADKVHHDVSGAGDDQKPEELSILHTMLDAVEDVLGEIYEEENIEDLLDGVLEKREDQKKLVGLPHLFQRIP